MSLSDKYSDIIVRDIRKPNIYIGTKNGTEYIIKLIPILDDFEYFKTERIIKYNEITSTHNINVKIEETEITKHKKLPDSISVHIRRNQLTSYYGIIVMEYMDGTIDKLWPFIDNSKRDELKSLIKEKIDMMHSLDIGHGDLHEMNIVYKDNDYIDVRIIDYDNSYYISTGKNNPVLREYMEENFEWEDSYKNFVEYDYKNWFSPLKYIKEPKSILFSDKIDINISSKYMGINSYNMARAIRKKLIKRFKMKFNIYGVYLNGLDILHYFVRMPGGLFYTDIKGMNKKQEQIKYWYDFLIKNNYHIQSLDFIKIDIIDIQYDDELDNLSNTIISEIIRNMR